MNDINKCQSLISLYKSILEKRDIFSGYLNNFDTKNIDEVKLLLKDIKTDFDNINNNFDKYKKDRQKWTNLYKKYMSIDADFSDVKIPNKPKKGDWCLVFVDMSLKIEDIINRIRMDDDIVTTSNENHIFRIYAPNDLYLNSLKDDAHAEHRIIKGRYSIWVQNSHNAEKYYKNEETDENVDLSAKDGIKFLDDRLYENCLETMTLRERILFDFFYFLNIVPGRNLDYYKSTLCFGSYFFDADSGKKYYPYVEYSTSFGVSVEKLDPDNLDKDLSNFIARVVVAID